MKTKVASPLYQVRICETVILPQLYQFWNIIQNGLVYKDSYIVGIGVIKIKLPKLQDNNKKAEKLRLERLSKSWKGIKEVLHYQDLPYVSKIICLKLISRYYNNFLVINLGIKKIHKLITKKYY